MRSALWLLTSILLSMPAHAEGAAPPQTKQAIYNEAQAAFDKEDWATAAKGFERIVLPPSGKSLPRAQAIIRAHLATCYLRLVRFDDAIESGKLAADGLSGQGGEDAADAWLTLGDALRFNLDMPAATDAYAKAMQQTGVPDVAIVKMRAELGAALANIVFDPAKAITHTDAVMGDPLIMKAMDKKQLAQIEDLRGMALANLGNPKEAIKFLRDAVLHSGGLSGNKVSLLQVGLRGDAAIVFQLLHDDTETHNYLSWTGAGHLKNDWTSGSNVEPPICGGAGDIKPEDTAVVQFSVNDVGKVISAVPIYASRTGEMGIEFARTVKEWRWQPEAVLKLAPFWRASVRMQLRCIIKPRGSELQNSFYRATLAWLNSKVIGTWTFKGLLDHTILTTSEKLSSKENEVSLQVLVVRWARAIHDRVEHRSLSGALYKALNEANAPADVLAFFIVGDNSSGGYAFTNHAYASAKYLGQAIAGFELQWPHTRAAAWLRTERAIALERAGDFKAARPELEIVLSEPETALPDDDAIRRLATLHLAAIKQHDGDIAGAKTLITNAGITDQQCSLMDVRPIVTNNAAASVMFPQEAMRWGFNGFVRTAFDIAADGSVKNTPAVLAYPPFIFDESAERGISHFRYLPPSIDGSALGCSGQNMNIVYKGSQLK